MGKSGTQGVLSSEGMYYGTSTDDGVNGIIGVDQGVTYHWWVSFVRLVPSSPVFTSHDNKMVYLGNGSTVLGFATKRQLVPQRTTPSRPQIDAYTARRLQ